MPPPPPSVELIEGKVFCHPQGKGVFVVPRGSQRGPVWPRKLWPEGIIEPENGATVKAEFQRNNLGGMIVRVISYSGQVGTTSAAQPSTAPHAMAPRQPLPPRHEGAAAAAAAAAAGPPDGAAAAAGAGIAGAAAPLPAAGAGGGSWANMLRSNAGSPNSGEDDNADPPGGRIRTATPSPSSPERNGAASPTGGGAASSLLLPAVVDRIREAVPNENPWRTALQPRPDTTAERAAFRAAPPQRGAINYGFGSLDTMVQQLPQPFSVTRLTKGFTAKGMREFAFPSVPVPNRYQVHVDPNLDAASNRRQRTPMQPLCDKHARYSALGVGCHNGLETVCIRLSTDSAVLPALTMEHFGAVVSDDPSAVAAPAGANDTPLFVRYMLDPYREAIHHNRKGWIIATDTNQVVEWLALHMPAVLDLHCSVLAEVCGIHPDGDLPDDFMIAVLVHLADERIDTYSWSPSHGRQVGVCFERWFGECDGFGYNPRPRA